MHSAPTNTAVGARRHGGPAHLSRLGLAIAAGAAVFANTAMAQPAAPAAPIEVVAGDTFAGIAARFTGSARTWGSVYNARLSGLRDPNLIVPGMRFELVSDAGGKRYLRLLGSSVANVPAAASVQAAAAPAAPTAPKPAAQPAPAPVAPAPRPVAAAAPVAPVPAAAAADPRSDELVVGVLPNIGADALMAQYESLKNYLERLNSHKVRIVVSANFKAFFEGMSRGDYDLSVAAPHFARVAQLDSRLVPLAMYEPRINALFITPIDSTLAAPRELRGKALAFANPQSLVAMYGRQWLQQQSLEPGKDYEVKAARTDVGVGRMLLTGDVAAAIMSNGEFRSIPQDESSRLKIVEIFARIPNFIIVGHPRLGKERLARLKTQLLTFLADKSDGAAFNKAAGISAIVDADDATLRELDPYTALTRRAMGVTN